MADHGRDIRRRLRDAALVLFDRQGFEGTTAARIAAEAGVTGRTFFRHFADKRDVLFDEESLRSTLLAGMAGAPAELGPLDAMRWAFRSAEPLLEENRSSARLRRKVIDANPALRERAVAKAAALGNDLAFGLRDRGTDERLAMLAAQVGMAACHQAIVAWSADASRPFTAHLDRAFADVYALIGRQPGLASLDGSGQP